MICYYITYVRRARGRDPACPAPLDAGRGPYGRCREPVSVCFSVFEAIV